MMTSRWSNSFSPEHDDTRHSARFSAVDCRHRPVIDQTVFALAGLGFFLAGLQMLSEVSRTLVGRRLRRLLAVLGRGRVSSALAGIFLGATTQSSSAAAYVCIGLLNARAVGMAGALSISAWAGVGTAVLVFVASINLRYAALCALAAVGVLYLSSLHRADAGHRLCRLLLAFGVTLLGLAMLKEAGNGLAASAWVKQLFLFSANSSLVEFFIGLLITLPLQSSSTVTILAITFSESDLLSLQDAVLMVGGAHIGSGLSVVWTSSHLTGESRQLALWQAAVKFLGALLLMPAGLMLILQPAIVGTLSAAFSTPMLLAMTYLALNVAGALLAVLWRAPLQRLLNAMAPIDPAPAVFEPRYLFAEASSDPETAFLLARQEQARLAALLPDGLSPLRQEVNDASLPLTNDARQTLTLGLLARISGFISEAVSRHPHSSDIRGLLLLKGANDHCRSLADTIHQYVNEIGAHQREHSGEHDLSHAMTEALHLLLGLLAEQFDAKDTDADFLEALTHDRSDMMLQIRNSILQQPGGGNASREALVLATGLFERAVWIIRQLSNDAREIAACLERERA